MSDHPLLCCRQSVETHASLDKKKINKVVLAYSGGLDTSVILKWLQETYDCEVVTFTADLGQVCHRILLSVSGPGCNLQSRHIIRHMMI